MRIAGVGSAFPKLYFKQDVIVAALKGYYRDRLVNPTSSIDLTTA